MYDRHLKLPKMTVVDLENDHEVISRVKHTMLRGEKLGQWYARTLIGRAEILKMTRDEISNRVAMADRNNANAERPGPQTIATPQPAPTRPLVMVG